MRAGERADDDGRRMKNWDEELDEGEPSDRLDEFARRRWEEEEEEEEEEDDFDAMSSERLGTHVVRVPVYLNVVGHHRELAEGGRHRRVPAARWNARPRLPSRRSTRRSTAASGPIPAAMPPRRSSSRRCRRPS